MCQHTAGLWVSPTYVVHVQKQGPLQTVFCLGQFDLSSALSPSNLSLDLSINEQSQNAMPLLSKQAGVGAGYTPEVSCVCALPLVQR